MPKRGLRRYQADPARAIVRAVLDRRAGRPGPGEFAVVFSRQSGKDEMLSQLCAYLLLLFHRAGGQIVVGLPTMRPQGQIALDRLAARVRNERYRAIAGKARVRDGSIVQLGEASVHFVSAAPTSSARGQTASLLLVANECQDIDPDRWDAVFAPMAAAENAISLYMGTVWTATTLLSRQMRYLRTLEAADGRQRLFLVPWRRVSEELPTYGRYVEGQIRMLGADHPFVQTEYELVELDAAGGLFPPSRQGQMQGDHAPIERGEAGHTYALLLDVAGEEEDQTDDVVQFDVDSRRDSTALTVVRVVRNVDPVSGESRPRYEVVRRYLWTGVKHTTLYHQLLDLARDVWKARYVVVDATGVGAGLTSFLRSALGDRVVLPFVFSQSSKSQLGWTFLGVIDSGRFKDFSALTPSPSPDDQERGVDTEAFTLSRVFWRQVRECTYDVRPGPNRLMSWSVPDPRTHDDLLLSAALVGVLEEQDWRPREAVGR
jgi:hypothetical protein